MASSIVKTAVESREWFQMGDHERRGLLADLLPNGDGKVQPRRQVVTFTSDASLRLQRGQGKVGCKRVTARIFDNSNALVVSGQYDRDNPGDRQRVIAHLARECQRLQPAS